MSDDRTKAEALRLAKAHMEKMRWRYSPKQLGETAREILDGLAKGKRDER